jgi:DNA repair ATPase RecN
VSHMKTKLTNEKIQVLNTQKDLLEITKAIDDITKVTSKLSDADADAATYGLKASLIAKEANSKKAEVQYNSTEKLANQAANRHEDAVKALEKLERSFTHESSNLKLITDNMKDAFDTLTNTYNDVKELSLSLLDEAFVPEKSSQTTDTLAAQ